MRSVKRITSSCVIITLLIVISLPIVLVDITQKSVQEKPLLKEGRLEETQYWDLLNFGFQENLGQLNISEVLLYTKLDSGILGLGENLIGEWDNNGNLRQSIVFEGDSLVQPVGVGFKEFCSNYILGSEIFTGVKHYSYAEFSGIWSDTTIRVGLTDDGLKCTFSTTSPESFDRIRLESNGLDMTKHIVAEKNRKILADDSNTTLRIIDELLFIGTYGGGLHHRGASVATDREGYIYVAGETVEKGDMLPYEKSDDSFIMKIAPDGNSLEYVTYIGGESSDRAVSLCVDDEGFIYITGNTNSDDFPADYVLDDIDDIAGDCFVLKLNQDGTTIEYSSIIGGHLEDEPFAMTIDDMDRVYITGRTNSEDFPTTTGCWDETYNGGLCDCIVFRLSADGSAIDFSTFIDAIDDENGHATGTDIELNSEGNIVIGGGATTDTFPLVNAYDDTYNGDYYDCFLLVLSSDGTSILSATLLGGSGGESVVALDLDANDNIIATGSTSSSNFPIKNGFDSVYAYVDAFLFKMSANCSSLIYSTYIGEEINEHGSDVVVDHFGNAYVVGWTNSEGFPIINAANYSFNDDQSGDAYLTVINENGTAVIYSTLFGGLGYDEGVSICFGPEEERLCMMGGTSSTDFPTVNCSAYPGTGENFFLVVYDTTGQYTYPSENQDGIFGGYLPIVMAAIVVLAIPLVIFQYQRHKS